MIERLVFDYFKWKADGEKEEDQDRYWGVATVIKEYDGEYRHQLADVRWSDGRVTHGHLVRAMLPVSMQSGVKTRNEARIR